MSSFPNTLSYEQVVRIAEGWRERAETAEAENERFRAIVQKIGEVLNEAPESDLKRALHVVFLGAIVDRVLGDD